ncbi:MAG: peptidylprolyl isomerase [Pseudohongiellaceae bacterium]|nr:peptidylprolyl isomerase [Pseudohongiellaceae bacterium]
MNKLKQSITGLLAGLTLALLSESALADEQSAQAAMEDPSNPLVQVRTSRGSFYIELFPSAAPRNVSHFIALAEGTAELIDPETQERVEGKFYANTYFHRVIPGLLTQGGAARRDFDPKPSTKLVDEINARQLGLHQMSAFNALGQPNPLLNLANKEDLDKYVLQPLYQKMGILSASALENRQFEVIETLRSLSLQQVYENMGYRYNSLLATRPALRASVGMASSEPNANGTQFFILNDDAPWLRGRVTIVGRVVEGMDIVDRINQLSRVGDAEREANLNNATMIFDISPVTATQ